MKELIELVKHLFVSISNTGKIIVLTSIILIIAIRYLVKLESFILFIKKTFKREKKEKRHGMFEYIDNILRFKLNSIDFGDKKKNKLFKEFFKIPLESLSYHMTILCGRKDINDLNEDEFRKSVMDSIYLHMNDVVSKTKNEFGDEIRDVIVKNNWLSDLNQFTLEYIQYELHNRGENETNKIVLSRIFAIMSLSLKIIFETSTPRFQKMNGNLTEILNKKYGKN